MVVMELSLNLFKHIFLHRGRTTTSSIHLSPGGSQTVTMANYFRVGHWSGRPTGRVQIFVSSGGSGRVGSGQEI
jgi:hypothetical protein